VLHDLVAQKLVNRLARVWIGRFKNDTGAIGPLFIAISNQRRTGRHRGCTRRQLAMRRHRFIERAVRKRRGDLLEVRSDLRNARGIGCVFRRHNNRAARFLQQKVMHGLVLIEAHGHRAALLEVLGRRSLGGGGLLHKTKVLFVRHARRHR
jgi:hypothetical protein